MCRAAQYLDENDVIHRDVKPANVLVDVVNGATVAKLADFGLAVSTRTEARCRGGGRRKRRVFRDVEARTRTFGDIGTPLYKAPELVGKFCFVVS